MTRRYVLDAWALLALLQREEPAASRVKQLFRDAPDADVERFISIINSYIQMEMLERIA